MDWTIKTELLAAAIGMDILQYIEETGKLNAFSRDVESQAIETLEEIRKVLDDNTLDDPACFTRIEQIVEIFHRHNLSTTRHDW